MDPLSQRSPLLGTGVELWTSQPLPRSPPISSFLLYHISPRSWGLSVHFLKFFVVAALVTLDPL